MEKKSGAPGGGSIAIKMLRSLLLAYVITGLLLLILTVLLYKTGLSEANVNMGITLTYVIATFAGGFLAGKIRGKRKFLWGILAGVLYFALLFLISLGLYHTISTDTFDLVTTFLLCAGGGMLGGMFA